MVFAINCGADDAPNSFSNFKKAALAVGASLSAAAASATPTPAPTAVQQYTTAAYGGYTIAAPPQGTVVTQPVTVSTSSWMTTYTSYPGSPAPTPISLEGQVHKVIVGGPGKLAFDPPRVDAAPRDTIVFEFHQKNHTVTQSTFDDPCRRATINGALGFDSGFFPVADDATEFPTWNYTVTDTAPVWAYCRQGNHCGSGMVFAINSVEDSGRSLNDFQNVAKALNGTSVSANSPTPTPSTPTGAATSIRVGATGIALLFVSLLSALL